jgi:hypothetical protein
MGMKFVNVLLHPVPTVFPAFYASAAALDHRKK